MREMDDPGGPLGPGLEPGGWLHLDVSWGCAGDMLSAALLDLGVDEAVLRRGLLDAGLGAVGPRVVRDHRGPLAGLHLSFADGAGLAVDAVHDAPRLRTKPASTRGRGRPRAPHLHPGKPEEEDKRAGVALDEEGPRLAEAEARDEEGEEPRPIGGQIVGPEGERERRPGRDPIEVWLAGERAVAEALLGLVLRSRLAPIAKALASKALRRALEGLARTEGVALDALSLPGRPAVDLLADVVSFAALLEALSPARVTASPVGISTAAVDIDGRRVPGPSPWVLAVLEGVRVLERDVDFETATPTGAALVWSVAHRFGPRGDLVVGRSGVGLGTRNPRDHANVCRALYAPPPKVASVPGGKAGQRRSGALLRLEAVLGPDEDPARLEAELLRLFASQLTFSSRLLPSGRPARVATLLVPTEHADEATAALFTLGGADEVGAVPAERRAAVVTAVTVRIGRGNKRRTVRVLERSLAGALLGAEPHTGDLLEAARALGLPLSTARADVLAAWSRLRGGGPPAGEGER